MIQFGKKANNLPNYFGRKFVSTAHRFGQKHHGLISSAHDVVSGFNSFPLPLQVSAISKPLEGILSIANKATVAKKRKSKIEK